MTAITTWLRRILLGLALAAFAPPAAADALPSPPAAAEKKAASPAPPPAAQKAGSPEMGVLIIIGVVGFLILLAWIFSRAGDDASSGGDRTMI